jgi:hypothetical protein
MFSPNVGREFLSCFVLKISKRRGLIISPNYLKVRPITRSFHVLRLTLLTHDPRCIGMLLLNHIITQQPKLLHHNVWK